MFKNELKKAVQAKLAENGTKISLKDAGANIDAVLESITEALVAGEEVKLVGFGTFKTRPYEAREAFNVATGEMGTLPAGKTLVFKPSDALKSAVKGK